ncbi:MAG: 4-aminobutyrate transaminase [Candidatus Sericytochromatia bacterium]|nr:MAG: 4-aminobutyrate transaminase [Candidatus Sericytochromatia bacterium]
MSLNENLINRRNKVVSRGIGLISNFTTLSGKGALLRDLEGNEYIDFTSGIGVTALGHCPEEIVSAIKNQADKLLHACIMVSTYEPYIELCETLVELFPHGNNTKVMLTNTGAESVENAIKIARQYTKKQAIICYSGAFHGRSYMAMSLTSKVSYKENCSPFNSEIYRLQFPSYYHYNDGLSYSDFIKREINRLNNFFNEYVSPNNVAAIIIELIQGEGGFNVAPIEYVQELRNICDKYNILLIFDEVQSGFCRTGKWAAYQHYNVIPDISTWAKALGSGLPIGAVIGKQEIMDSAITGTLGGTYIGNPLSCVSAIETIKYMKKNNINQKALEIGEKIKSNFEPLKKKYSGIGDIRGLGAMMAIEFVKNNSEPDSEFVSTLLKSCWKRNLLVINSGLHKNVLRFLIPLTIENELLEKGLNIIKEEIINLYS